MKIYRFLIFLVFFCGITGVKAGDNDTIVMSYTVDEVIIQSFKRNDNLSQLSVSASLLTEQTIKERNISNIKEISSFIPNLFIPDYGSKMTSPVYIRGIGSRINAPSIGLYVDGIPYFDRAGFDINIQDIDRIEVLRGPQGTIYGRNTMGGIINIYTKSPFKYRETNLTLSASNYNTYQGNASFYRNIKNKIGYSLAANYLRTGGYIENKYTGKKANSMDAVSVRGRLSWHAAQDLYIHLTSAYEYSDQNGYPYGIYNTKENVVEDVNYNAPSFFRRNMSTTGLNVQYNRPNFRFNSQTSFQYIDGRQGIDQDFTPLDNYYVVFDLDQKMFSQEFNIKSLGESNYEWLFGAFAFYQDYNTFNKIRTIPKDSLNFQDVDTNSKGLALFHQSAFNNIIINGLSATLGVRYDLEKIKANTNLWSVNREGNESDFKEYRDNDVYSQVTPKLSLKYKFTNDEIVYASVTKGYKAGGFNNTAQNEADRIFLPEHSWSYEIGAKASCLDKMIYTDISLFYIYWNNQQVTQLQPDGKGFILRNAGKSTSKGVELNMHMNPLKNLSFHLSYGYTYATFKEYEYSPVKDYSGNYLPMVPKNTFSVAANYSLKLKNKDLLDKVTINTQYTGAGRLYWKEDNVVSQPFYGLLDARVSFLRKNISVDLWAKNITDTNYITYYFSSAGVDYAQRGKPFTLGINLNIKLN